MRTLLALMFCLGCSSRTELVIGVATDLRAKGEIDLVRLVASRNDTPIVQTEWPLSDAAGQRYELPGSFGLYSGDGSATEFSVSIKGYKGGNLVVVREADLSLVSGQTLFMRVGLVNACIPGHFPVCDTSETCIDGVCRKRSVDSKLLPKYKAELVTKTECTPNTQYIVSSTGDPMGSIGDTCPAGMGCHEGTCWTGPGDVVELPDLSSSD